jgi:hypothetical protein
MNEEAAQRARAEKARHQKEEVEEMKQTTVDDLTKGIVNYKHLGLDFEKAARGSLRYVYYFFSCRSYCTIHSESSHIVCFSSCMTNFNNCVRTALHLLCWIVTCHRDHLSLV